MFHYPKGIVSNYCYKFNSIFSFFCWNGANSNKNKSFGFELNGGVQWKQTEKKRNGIGWLCGWLYVRSKIQFNQIDAAIGELFAVGYAAAWPLFHLLSFAFFRKFKQWNGRQSKYGLFSFGCANSISFYLALLLWREPTIWWQPYNPQQSMKCICQQIAISWMQARKARQQNNAIQFAFSNSMVPQIKRSLAATNHWMESKWMGNCYFIITIWFKITVINSIQHCLLWRNLRIDCINESKSKQKQWLNGAPVIYLLLLLFDFGVGWFHCCILPANCFVGGKNANGGLYGCLQPNQ